MTIASGMLGVYAKLKGSVVALGAKQSGGRRIHERTRMKWKVDPMQTYYDQQEENKGEEEMTRCVGEVL